MAAVPDILPTTPWEPNTELYSNRHEKIHVFWGFFLGGGDIPVSTIGNFGVVRTFLRQFMTIYWFFCLLENYGWKYQLPSSTRKRKLAKHKPGRFW